MYFCRMNIALQKNVFLAKVGGNKAQHYIDEAGVKR